MRFSLDLDEYTTEYGVVFRKIYRPDGSFQFEMRDYPLKQPSLDAIQKYPWPDPLDAARYRGVEERVRHLYETTDYAITCRLGENIFEQATYMRGQENWLMDLILHRDFAVALMQRLADIQRTIYLKGLDLVGKYISVIRLGGEDLGTQHGPLISLQMFRELVKPILASVYLPVKAKFLEMNPNGKLMLHSCGSVRAFINDFIESGVDVLDPVQTQAEGMNGLSLKREFGNAISFHGGINTQSVLPFGTKEDVELESKRKLEMLAPGGGYILDPSHNVQADVPPRNLIRMVEVAKSYGRYPIQRNFSDDELLALCV
jgi:uroporphyrinogen decarboxylase